MSFESDSRHEKSPPTSCCHVTPHNDTHCYSVPSAIIYNVTLCRAVLAVFCCLMCTVMLCCAIRCCMQVLNTIIQRHETHGNPPTYLTLDIDCLDPGAA